MILLFLSFKADPNIPNFRKKTAYDIADLIEFDLKRLVRLFKDEDNMHEDLTTCGN